MSSRFVQEEIDSVMEALLIEWAKELV